MKPNAARLKQIMSSDNLDSIFLIQLDWNTQHYYTTAPHDLTWNGNLYSSDCPVMAINPPQYNTVVDREIYAIKMSALDPLIKSEIDAGVVYKPVSVRIGFMVDGVFQDGLQDTMYSYKGRVGAVTQDTNIEESTYSIECTAALSDLDQASPRFTTVNSQQLRYPGDTCFAGINEGFNSVKLDWGKI